MDIIEEIMGFLVRCVTRVFYYIGIFIGSAVQELFHKGLMRANIRGVPKKTEKDSQEKSEEQRLAGCEEVVRRYALGMGFIAREAISRDELEQLIDSGISAQGLAEEIVRRMMKVPGIWLGVFADNPNISIKLPTSLRDRHVYIVGRSGSGKTNIIKNMLYQDLDSGHGIGVLAPELEMITNDILPHIPKSRIDDVVFVNPADIQYPVPFNPLHLDPNENIDIRVDETITVFKRIMGEIQPRMEEILRQTLYALMERPGSTLLDVEPLLSRQDDTLRREIIQRSHDPQTKQFFRETYNSFPKDAHIPIVTRINRLIRAESVRTFLCQPGISFNFRKAMDAGKILLFNLSDGVLGEQNAQLLGQLIVSKIQMAALSRVDIPPEERRPFYLYLDEFQTFTGVAEASYSKILSRARKYALCCILAHQQTGQLSQELLHEILGNVTTILTFSVSSSDARKLSQEYAVDFGSEMDYIPPEEFLRLKIGEAWAKIGKNVLPLKTELANKPPDFLLAKETMERSRQNYGISADGDGWYKQTRTDNMRPVLEPLEITHDIPDPGKVFE
jgi:hypothetical protein